MPALTKEEEEGVVVAVLVVAVAAAVHQKRPAGQLFAHSAGQQPEGLSRRRCCLKCSLGLHLGLRVGVRVAYVYVWMCLRWVCIACVYVLVYALSVHCMRVLFVCVLCVYTSLHIQSVPS